MRNIAAALVVLLPLASCGGGGSDAPPVAAAPNTPTTPVVVPPGPVPLPTPAPLIQYKATYVPDVETQLVATGGVLTIDPIGTAISANPVASVGVTVDGLRLVALAQPNARNSAGSGRYVFNVPVVDTRVAGQICGRMAPLEITVTDVTGFTYTKYILYCSPARFDIGGFSDYGSITATFRAVASAPNTPAQLIPSTLFDARIVDAFPEFSWVARAKDSDSFAGGVTPLPGETGEISIKTETDGEATSYGLGLPPPYLNGVNAALSCCGKKDATADTEYRLSVGRNTALPLEFSFYYQLYDPATGTMVKESRQTSRSYTQVDVLAKPGQVLTVEAVPTDAARPDFPVSIDVVIPRRDGRQGVLGILGRVQTNRPGFSARMKLPCC